MPISRRIRAVLVMMALWTVPLTVVGALVGLGIWFFVQPANTEAVSVNLLRAALSTVRIFAAFGAVTGIIAGAGFALALSGRRELEAGQLPRVSMIRNGLVFGGVAGMAGYTLFTAAFTSMSFWHTGPALLFAGICSLVGGTAAATLIGVARRGKALPVSSVDDLLLSKPE